VIFCRGKDGLRFQLQGSGMGAIQVVKQTPGTSRDAGIGRTQLQSDELCGKLAIIRLFLLRGVK
jgi:hypothetical protein